MSEYEDDVKESPLGLSMKETEAGELRLMFEPDDFRFKIDATALRHVWHVRCLDTLKGLLLESYEICPLPELVLAAPEDLLDSLQRLDEVCSWLASGPPA